MTIKAWNNLPEVTREKVARIVANASGYQDEELINKLKGKYISSMAKLSPHQEIIIKSLKYNREGNVELNLKIVI